MNADIVTGVQVTIIGFSIVIISLFVLYLIIHVLGRFLNPEAVTPSSAGFSGTAAKEDVDASKTATSQTEGKKAETTSVKEDIESEKEKKVGTSGDEIDPEVVAAISASIAVVLGSDKGFKIKGIRPIKRNEELSHWTVSGREELMKPHEII